MLFYSVLGLMFIFGTLMALFLLSLLSRSQSPVKRRLKELQSSLGNFDLKQEVLQQAASGKNKLDPKIEKAMSALSGFSKKNDQYESKLKKTLMQAGFYQENASRLFLSSRLLLAILLFVLYGFISYVAGLKVTSIFLMGGVMAFIGYMLPTLYLSAKVRRRQDEIAGGLPDALDFLVICVEAGLGLNSALIRVGQELRLRCKALAEELLLVNQEMRTGISREQALRNLSERNDQIRDLKVLAGAIILSDRLGTNIADTLRAQSDSLRTKVRQRAEERAAKAGIKMLFPLVFFIMPALFIVILGPGIIMIVKTLMPIVQQ